MRDYTTYPSIPLGLALTAVLSGCAPEIGARVAANAAAAAGSRSEIELRILVPRCATAGCHSGNPPAVFPRLEEGASWDAMVGVSSEELPSMDLVEPGDPERSYLVLKLRGTAGAQGGSGLRMPPSAAPLDEAELTGIEAWITGGAPND
ncbi:MAG: hypothetical protein A2V77_21745 [Anaeromyxobacter sp. RBG_16_69_14]|nr:MAG: hypothetical protein A2V77_21745 [Anaeromyxobacter sp. RBG_16_69_14]